MSRAFTLVELLVVMLIIAVLMSLLFPVLSRAQERARATSCLANQRHMAAAIMGVVQDHSETFPKLPTVWQDINLDAKSMQCPSASHNIITSYVYNSYLSGVALGQVTFPLDEMVTADGFHAAAKPPITYDSGAYSYQDIIPRHSFQPIISYVDGHVQSTPILPYKLGMCLNLKTSAPGSIVKDAGNAVSSWGDQSAQVNNATQTTAANCPTFVPNALAGQAVLRFGPTGRLDTNVLIHNARPRLLIAVLRFPNTSVGDVFTSGNPTGNGNAAWNLSNSFSTNGQLMLNHGSGGTSMQTKITSADYMNLPIIVSVNYDGTTESIYVNGKMTNSAAIGLSTAATPLSFPFAGGDLAAVTLYDANVPSRVREQLENDYGTLYHIAVSH